MFNNYKTQKHELEIQKHELEIEDLKRRVLYLSDIVERLDKGILDMLFKFLNVFVIHEAKTKVEKEVNNNV
jgi:hypothetical protein